MSNSYVSLDVLKGHGALNITGSADDARLRALIEAVSRTIDRYCNRHFYVLQATRHFDGPGGPFILVPDLVSVDAAGLKTDEDLDGTYEVTWAASDYLLLPSNADPATPGNPQSRPYTRIEVDVLGGGRRGFPTGRQTVQVAGQWGWWRHLRRASETANAIADASTTSVSVSSRADVEAGHTLLVDSEQMYVKSYSGNTLTVIRGVNGTTATAHAGGAAIDIYEYPGPVTEACILQVTRLWLRRGSVSVPSPSDGLDPDVRLLLGPYRKLAVGV